MVKRAFAQSGNDLAVTGANRYSAHVSEAPFYPPFSSSAETRIRGSYTGRGITPCDDRRWAEKPLAGNGERVYFYMEPEYR